MPENITHSELISAGEKWLYNALGCGVVVKELTTAYYEIPDLLAFKGQFTILIECKISRSDFLADQKKTFRQIPEQGVGDFRLYLCPTGLITINDLPDKWGLLYYNKDYTYKNKIARIHTPKGNIWHYSGNEFLFEKNVKAEYAIMYSIIRRIKLNNCLDVIYNKKYLENMGGENNAIIPR